MAAKSVGLNTQIWNNNLLSTMMLFVLPATLFILVSASIGLWFVVYPEGFLRLNKAETLPLYDVARLSVEITFANMHYILGVVGAWYAIAWVFNREMIMAATGAKEVARTDEPQLYNLLENLSISVGITMPRLAIIETEALNAFASGIDRNSYTVTVTRGLMDVLEKDELEAVIAHELSHIQNNDVRLMVIISIFSGMVGAVASLAKSIFWPSSSHHHNSSGYGFRSHSSSSSNRDGRIALFILGLVVLSFLASVVTNLVKLYISRRREFMADAGAVKLTHSPEAMIRALHKISGNSAMPAMPSALAGMCISPSSIKNVLSTHPTIESRVDALQHIAGYKVDAADIAVKDRRDNVRPSGRSWENTAAMNETTPHGVGMVSSQTVSTTTTVTAPKPWSSSASGSASASEDITPWTANVDSPSSQTVTATPSSSAPSFGKRQQFGMRNAANAEQNLQHVKDVVLAPLEQGSVKEVWLKPEPHNRAMREDQKGLVHPTRTKSLSRKNAKKSLSSRGQDQLKAKILSETRKAIASEKKGVHNPKDQVPNDAAGFVTALVLGHDL